MASRLCKENTFWKIQKYSNYKRWQDFSARLVVDATGYDPVFLKLKSCGP